MAAMPTPDLAVPYEAPRQVKTIDAVQPMAPKKGCARSVRERACVDVFVCSIPIRSQTNVGADVVTAGGLAVSTRWRGH
jgi:hypothetical protein